MHRLRLRTPSPALVVSTIALVVAMGGTSYAAFSLPNNSVGTKALKNGAVTRKKITNGAVTRAKINFSSLGTVPSANNAIHANTANTATSANTANTATTAGSANALNGTIIVAGTSQPNNHGTQRNQLVTCPSGMHAIGGGIVDDGGTEQSVNEWFITSSGATPATTNNEVDGFVNNTSTTRDDTFHVWAVCINGTVGGAALAPRTGASK